MKNNSFLYILTLLLFSCATNISAIIENNNNSSAITWKPNNGRFGDKLISYAKAKWLSYTCNIPLLYVPFNYSDQLIMHEQELNIEAQDINKTFSNIVDLPTNFSDPLIPNNNTLYISYWGIKVKPDWNDASFINQLKSTIAPRYPLKKITPPKGYISIAVHVRNGGGFYFDYDAKRESNPLQFVPDEFFINQIIRLTEMFSEEKLYVYIFTDYQKPIEIKERFKKIINNPRITFDCRTQDNSHSTNVLEDFFSMMDFDCLIRPVSNFSKFAQYVGNNKVVIVPSGMHKNSQGKAIIDTITIKTRDNINDRWKTKRVRIA